MEKLFSYLDPKSPVPLDERQARLLIAVLCGVYALAAIYILVAGATLLIQITMQSKPPDQLTWALGYIALGILLAAIVLGLWQPQHWAVTLSALLLIAALVYSILGDIPQANWLMAGLKIILIPAILTGHSRLWKEARRHQQDSA